jgi:hypothetical protein
MCHGHDRDMTQEMDGLDYLMMMSSANKRHPRFCGLDVSIPESQKH